MPLPMPRLDNRTYEELAREGSSLIPQRAPSWTDHNAHDPGITLLELFAWLTEMDVYRLDRTSDAAYRTFLRLLGIDPEPPRVAQSVLELTLTPKTNEMAMPAGLQIGNGSDLVFETHEAVFLSAARLVSVQGYREKTKLSDFTQTNCETGNKYLPFGTDPRGGDSLYLGFDRPLGEPGNRVSLYIWTGTHETDVETRKRLIAEWEASKTRMEEDVLNRTIRRCGGGKMYQANSAVIPDWRQHYSARTVWEYLAPWEPQGELPGVIIERGKWKPIRNVEDETRGLTLSGFVRFAVPSDHYGVRKFSSSTRQIFPIRCRLISGHYECPQEIDRIALNVVSASHGATVKQEKLGMSDGRAGQTFYTRRSPVVAGSVQLYVEAQDEPWQEVANWDRVGPHDRTFQVIPETGGILFGDGRIGWVPPAGTVIRCTYGVGGSAEGNVEAGQLTELVDETLRSELYVLQPFAAFGGAPAETFTDAQGRAIRYLAKRRAITLEDFEQLALETPGVPVASARALSDYHPHLPGMSAPGCVTVVVVPRCPSQLPEPGPDFLRAVKCYLEPRRALTTELHVIGPTYVVVTVHARLHIEQGSHIHAIHEQAVKALDDFFNPLTGGPDRNGWPIGRDVYRSEVLAVLNDLPEVLFIDQFALSREDDGVPTCTNIAVCPDSLVAPGKHRIQVMERRKAK